MRNRKAQGFTLIELLIVIAIIGILAAVLIPNLMNARTTAAQRAAQAHSSNVYTALVAVLSEDVAIQAGDIVQIGDDTCIVNATTPITYNSGGAVVTSNYSFNASPGGVTSCDIAADGTSDFDVEVIYSTAGSADYRVYENGQDVTP